MRHSLPEIYNLVSSELPEPGGFPLRALMSGVAVAEGGDPDAWVAHDPPSNPNAAPSSGLYQVNRGSYPKIYDQTEQVRLHPGLSDEEKILAMTELVKPIVSEMLNAALSATHLLATRGIAVDPLNTALFVDAAWQSGAGHLEQWARRTRTGDPREIVNPPRTNAVEAILRSLASQTLGVVPGAAVAALLVGGLLVGGLVLSKLDDWFA